jgi:hypothetical protein
MAVRLHSLNLLVPVRLIEQRYPGGLEACIDDHEALIGDRIWCDARLWRDGADTPAGMRALVDGWVGVGLHPVAPCGDGWRWNELCVVDSALGAPTLPCDWIGVAADGRQAALLGVEPGPLFGPEDFPRAPRVRAQRRSRSWLGRWLDAAAPLPARPVPARG